MKLAIIVPAWPPQLDGIGDYSARLASVFSISNQVVVFTAEDRVVSPIEGVRMVQCFQWTHPRSNWQLLDHLRNERPDWAIVQYNPFSWGLRGFNMQLPRVLRRMRDFTKVAVMFHERYFAPVTNLRGAMMAGYQRWQYRQLVTVADLSLYSTEPWLADHQRRFPAKPAYHLPVGSNIPLADGSHEVTRRTLGIDPDTLVLGLFGSAHVSRLLDWIHLAAGNLQATGRKTLLLYIGPHQQAVVSAMRGIPVRCVGVLAAEEVSRHLRAVDIFLSPFADGVSTRRGSFIAALQHGLATVGTEGESTGPLLASHCGQAFILTPCDSPDAFVAAVLRVVAEPDLRRSLEQKSVQLFQTVFSWEQIASRLTQILQRGDTPREIA